MRISHTLLPRRQEPIAQNCARDTRLRGYTALAIAFSLSGCFGSTPSGPDPQFAATLPTPTKVEWQTNGAIYQTSSGYAPLTSGARASRVGDILTIQLIERTTATKSNSASSSKNSNFGLTPPTTGPFALFNPGDVKIGGDSSFSGSGQAAQTNNLSGEISVTIAEVYPGGTMKIRGEKLINLNRGEEFIRMTGIVRAADISNDNRILSSRVADARITYAGSGEIAQASKQGWLQKFFSSISPF